MEYIVEKDQSTHKLSEEEREKIALKIKEEFRTLNNGRGSQLDKAQKLIDEIFFKNVASDVPDDPSKKWRSRMKMCKIFMYSQILKAFIWKNVYANTASMFDVSGESLEADNNSNKQKTMLVDCLEKMDYPKTLDKIIDYCLIYGETISFCTWKKHSEEYRRPIEFFDALKNPKVAAALLKGEKFYTDEKVCYDNPYIYMVDPANFVFDTTQQLNWDSCPKINRTWKTPEDIINNKYYTVSKEVAEDLRAAVKSGANEADLSDQDATSLQDEDVNGSTVECLEHWGDLQLPDGTVLKNWYAVVVGGKYLVQFEKNPLIINPFSYGAFITDPSNRRGISPLYSVYDIALTQEQMLRHSMDLAKLNENKPCYAPKGFFGEDPGDIEMHPGKVIEYEGTLYTQKPESINFEQNVFINDLSYIDDLMSEISGIFPNMAGATEKDRTTATEVSTKVEGQLTRLKMLLDCINQNLILSDVKNVAKLKANFTFGTETIFVNKDNNPENVEVDDEVRQADYRYTYADRSATSERFNYADMIAQAGQMFLKSGLPLNLEEFFKYYMEQKGVENPERFLMAQNLLAPEVQQALMENPQLAPIIQEMQNRVQMAKQGQELPDDGGEFTPSEQEQPQDFEQTLNSLPGRNLLSE